MRALMKLKPAEGAEFSDVEVPKPKPHEALIKVRAASLCGTDLHIYYWNSWAASRLKTPLIFGHECAGEVVELGSEVSNLSVGDHVSVETHIACENCYQCKTDQEHLCQNVEIIGVDRAGAFAEYLCVPARNCWKNEKSMPWEVATLLEPFGNAVHSVHAGEGVSGKTVLVSGCGPIGIMSIAIAKAQGATAIYATDLNDYRMNLAKEMGATDVFHAKNVDVFDAIMQRTEGNGVDSLLEMSGAPSAIEDGFRSLKNGGEVALLGLPNGPMSFNLAEHVILKGAKVHGIFGRKMFSTWYQSKNLVESQAVDLKKLITHKLSLDRFSDAMSLMKSGACGKVVFRLE